MNVPATSRGPALAGSRRYALLDTLKGLACLEVILHHSTFTVAGPLDGPGGVLIGIARAGWFGVPVFFAISGYCIATSADGRRRGPSPASEFFARRFRRIYPPLWIYLGLLSAVVLAAGAAGHSGLFSDGHHAIARPGDLGLWQWVRQPHADRIVAGDPLRGHVAAVFHGAPLDALLRGAILRPCAGVLLAISPRRWFAGIACVTAAVAALLIGRGAWPGLRVEGLFLDGRWLLFATGILVYEILARRGRRARVGAAVALAACAVVLGRPALSGVTMSNLRTSMAVGVGTASALLAIAPWQAGIASWPPLRPLNWLGVRCFSVYLVHFPIARAVSHSAYDAGLGGPWPTLLITIPCVIALTVIAAWAFHALVERRFSPKPSPPRRIAAGSGRDSCPNLAQAARSWPHNRGPLVAKRAFDLLASAAGLLALSPLLAAVAIVVKLGSRGPILFRHRRVGRDGRDFTLLKFRTMTVRDGADRGSFDAGDRSRVTRSGRLLRATKLDELPQLWNVLVGEMSLVGPRPEVRSWVDLDPGRWSLALSVRPGITDPASILYRDEESLLAASPDPTRLYAEHILPRKLSIYERYARSRTFLGDLTILWETARALASPRPIPSASSALPS